jgi:hypothetical protein
MTAAAKAKPSRRAFNFEYVGGRRYLLCCATLLVTTVLVVMSKVSGEVYATVVLGTVGAYIAGNVAQRKVEAGT